MCGGKCRHIRLYMPSYVVSSTISYIVIVSRYIAIVPRMASYIASYIAYYIAYYIASYVASYIAFYMAFIPFRPAT
jgi:hypothetical protein